jgi:hypothetical protein
MNKVIKFIKDYRLLENTPLVTIELLESMTLIEFLQRGITARNSKKLHIVVTAFQSGEMMTTICSKYGIAEGCLRHAKLTIVSKALRKLNLALSPVVYLGPEYKFVQAKCRRPVDIRHYYGLSMQLIPYILIVLKTIKELK